MNVDEYAKEIERLINRYENTNSNRLWRKGAAYQYELKKILERLIIQAKAENTERVLSRGANSKDA